MYCTTAQGRCFSGAKRKCSFGYANAAFMHVILCGVESLGFGVGGYVCRQCLGFGDCGYNIIDERDGWWVYGE